jgi:hypothetical protein
VKLLFVLLLFLFTDLGGGWRIFPFATHRGSNAKLQKIVKTYHKRDIRDYSISLFLIHKEFGDFLKFIELTMFFWDVLLVVSICDLGDGTRYIHL